MLSRRQVFYKEYGELIADSRIDVWIYGHSHTNIDTVIGGTRIISNQMGYVFEDEHENAALAITVNIRLKRVSSVLRYTPLKR